MMSSAICPSYSATFFLLLQLALRRHARSEECNVFWKGFWLGWQGLVMQDCHSCSPKTSEYWPYFHTPFFPSCFVVLVNIRKQLVWPHIALFNWRDNVWPCVLHVDLGHRWQVKPLLKQQADANCIYFAIISLLILKLVTYFLLIIIVATNRIIFYHKNEVFYLMHENYLIPCNIIFNGEVKIYKI